MDGEEIFNFECPIEKAYIKSDSPEPVERDILIEAYLKDELRVNPDLLCHTHFILVLDISGSMNDPLESSKTKLEAVLEATSHVIGELKDKDLVSIITFSNNEKIFCWGQSGKERNKLKHRLKEIYKYPRGATNLSPALKVTQEKLEEMSSQNYSMATKLLLLTDGRIHDVEMCEPLAHEFQEEGIDIDTMGIGEDFHGEDMDRLTSGFMETLENAGQTKAVFEKSLRILQNTVATKVKVELAPTQGVEIRGMAKISPDVQLISTDKRIILFENVDRNRRYAAVVRALIDSSEMGEKAVLTITLSFDIPKKNIIDESIERVVVVHFLNDETKLSQPPNSEVIHASTYYTIALRAQEIQENNDNTELVMRNLKLMINRLKKIGDMETMTRWEAVRDDYIKKGEFSLEEYNKVAVSKTKTSTAYSALPPPDTWDEAYDDDLTW